MTDALDPWDRQRKEPEKAYSYFVAYRDLGRARTVAKVADTVHKSREYLHKVATQWRWVQRAGAWDREQDREFGARMADRRREMADRHARLAVAAQNKIVSRLQSFNAEQLTASDIIRWLEVTTRLERLAVGLPETTTGHSGPDGGPLELEFSGLDEVQRAAYFARLLAEAKARAGGDAPHDDTGDDAGAEEHTQGDRDAG